jgi:cytochrome c oxidase subunit 2
MTPADYQAWLGGGSAGGSMADAGAKLFTDLACNTCHLEDGKGRGPSLKGVYGKQVLLASGQMVAMDDAYMRESILNPQAKIVAGFQPAMPTFQGLVTEEQLLQLIAYVKSLGGLPPAASAPATAPETPAAKK